MQQAHVAAGGVLRVADHGVETARLMHGTFVNFILRKACLVFWLQRFVHMHNDARALIAAQRAADQSPDNDTDAGGEDAGESIDV